jgi:hypothetical protein
MTSTLPPVARNINVFCKKCNADRYFKVITHTSETTAKLKCEVCGCSRKYTLDEEKVSATVVKKKTAVKSTGKKNNSASAWLTMKEKYEGPEALPYTVVSQFKDKQSLVHPTFGVGFVTKALPHKIEVLFAEGIKELMHARK